VTSNALHLEKKARMKMYSKQKKTTSAIRKMHRSTTEQERSPVALIRLQLQCNALFHTVDLTLVYH